MTDYSTAGSVHNIIYESKNMPHVVAKYFLTKDIYQTSKCDNANCTGMYRWIADRKLGDGRMKCTICSKRVTPKTQSAFKSIYFLIFELKLLLSKHLFIAMRTKSFILLGLMFAFSRNMTNEEAQEVVGETICTGVLTAFKKLMRSQVEKYMIGTSPHFIFIF